MAAIPLFWDTNMAAVTSRGLQYAKLMTLCILLTCLDESVFMLLQEIRC